MRCRNSDGLPGTVCEIVLMCAVQEEILHFPTTLMTQGRPKPPPLTLSTSLKTPTSESVEGFKGRKPRPKKSFTN